MQNTYEILNDKQFGTSNFDPSILDTYMPIIELVDKINTAVEKKKPETTIIGIFLDLVQVQVYLFPSLYTKCKNSQVKYI